MFKYEKETYDVQTKDDEIYYWIMMNKIFNLFSPYEVIDDDFPKKDELGGVIIKFVGGGACYFKVQREMPSCEELKSITEIWNYIKDTYGPYARVYIMCEPHIEIIDINLPKDTHITYSSSQKNDGDVLLNELIMKLENGEELTNNEQILRFILPFMSRQDNDEFQSKYDKFTSLYHDKFELPDINDLKKSNLDMDIIYDE